MDGVLGFWASSSDIKSDWELDHDCILDNGDVRILMLYGFVTQMVSQGREANALESVWMFIFSFLIPPITFIPWERGSANLRQRQGD